MTIRCNFSRRSWQDKNLKSPALIQMCCQGNQVGLSCENGDCVDLYARALPSARALSIAKIKSPVGSSCGRWAPRCCHQRPRPRPAGGGSGWPHAAAGWGVAGRSILRGPTPDGTDLKPPQRKKKQKTNVLAHLPVYSSTIVRNTWFKRIKWR